MQTLQHGSRAAAFCMRFMGLILTIAGILPDSEAPVKGAYAGIFTTATSRFFSGRRQTSCLDSVNQTRIREYRIPIDLVCQ
jgi:hypothetical protein